MKRWLVRGGIALGVLALLSVAFYAEENWRGARLWAATKAEYEAKGFSFDPKSLIPPPIPDEENFAKSEIWKHLLAASESNSKHASKPKSLLLDTKKASSKWRDEHIKLVRNWKLGQKVSALPITLFDSAQSELVQLYAANHNYPACRFNTDYELSFPPSIPMPHAGACHTIVSTLSLHALAALDVKQPDVAFQDMLTSLKLASGCYAEPALIYGLTTCNSIERTLATLVSGMDSHQWSDAQLADLQKRYADFDLLRCCVRAFKGELVLYFIKTVDQLNEDRFKVISILDEMACMPKSFFYNRPAITLGPSGWYDDLKSTGTRYYLDTILLPVEPENHRVIWTKHACHSDDNYLNSYHPLASLMGILVAASDTAISKFAEAQSYLDMAQIACGLERYWLVHKKYPATLAELVPKYLAKVPHDLCNGEPLHYRVEAEGNYTLYSVGFNGTDDGGRIVMKTGNPSNIDMKQGDWVWPRSKP